MPLLLNSDRVLKIGNQVLSSGGANPGLRSQDLELLRKALLTRGILPTSYYLARLDLGDRDTTAGYADVWEAHLDGRKVSVKALRAQPVGDDLEEIKRVCNGISTRERAQSNCIQRFYQEILEWKYVSHQNLVPVLGFSDKIPPFCIINPWLKNGNILNYLGEKQEANRLKLVCDPHDCCDWAI